MFKVSNFFTLSVKRGHDRNSRLHVILQLRPLDLVKAARQLYLKCSLSESAILVPRSLELTGLPVAMNREVWSNRIGLSEISGYPDEVPERNG